MSQNQTDTHVGTMTLTHKLYTSDTDRTEQKMQNLYRRPSDHMKLTETQLNCPH